MSDDKYEIRDGIAYRKPRYEGDADALYAYCDRCGQRPIVNNKCLECDAPEPGEQAKRLAKLVSRCMETHHSGGFTGGWDHTSFNKAQAAKIIQICLTDGAITQATNEDFKED